MCGCGTFEALVGIHEHTDIKSTCHTPLYELIRQLTVMKRLWLECVACCRYAHLNHKMYKNLAFLFYLWFLTFFNVATAATQRKLKIPGSWPNIVSIHLLVVSDLFSFCRFNAHFTFNILAAVGTSVMPCVLDSGLSRLKSVGITDYMFICRGVRVCVYGWWNPFI